MSVGNALKQAIYIVGAKRTAFGTFGGSLTKYSPVQMQEWAAKAALSSSGVKPENVDSVCIGNVLSSSSVDSPYMARHVLLRCGIPIPVPALTVNRLCGSGFQSVVNGIQEILVGDANVVLTGGTDNMSACPYAVRDIRFGTKLGTDPILEDMMWASLTDQLSKTPMGVTAENLAAKYDISREEVDKFSFRSQQTWAKAQESGWFDEEICPVTIKSRKGEVEFKVDEHPKPKTTLEQLAKLKPVFKKDGTVTAGSASGICDGAGAVIIANEDAIKKHNLKPLARIVGYGLSGCEPTIMGIGPVPAIQALCEKTGVSLGQVEELEINEAFAPQTMACQKALDYPMEKLNTCGGAIALGHPLAASGSRITTHLVYKMKRLGIKYSIGSACIGGGQGIALLLENV